jgi:hypothetical protein
MKKSLAVLTIAGFFLAGANCNDDPCEDYIDYICQCHDDDPDFSCEDVKTTLEDADPEVKNQCALDLDELQVEDADNGDECDVL